MGRGAASLLRKGTAKEAKLVFLVHALMENRQGILADSQVTKATGSAERDVVPAFQREAEERGFHPKTLGADKGYDTRGCMGAVRARRVTHRGAAVGGRSIAIGERTPRHRGSALSQRVRKRVEETFGWMQTVGGFRRTRSRGVERRGLQGYLVARAYNLVRIAKAPPRPSEAALQAQAA